MILSVVDEDAEANTDPIDGNWSPWSAFVTPCINRKTGQKVNCGSGVMLRHRSCTNPVPRFGGKDCPGTDLDEYPCNTHNCACEYKYLNFSRLLIKIFPLLSNVNGIKKSWT